MEHQDEHLVAEDLDLDSLLSQSSEESEETVAERLKTPLSASRSDLGPTIVYKHFLISHLDTVLELPRELVVVILQLFIQVY
jgi:hypothetical protein